MERLDDYIQIMIDSLEKKSEILSRLIDKNASQNKIISGKSFEEIDWDMFNIVVAEKEAEIERINKMDEGFQALYDRLSDQLKDNKSQYAAQIKRMQALIVELEDKSVKIRTGEERNRNLIESTLSAKKKDIRQARANLKTASAYYQTMSKALELDSATVDKKK